MNLLAFLSLLIGLVGLGAALWQGIRLKSAKKIANQLHMNLAREAGLVLSNIQHMKEEVKKGATDTIDLCRKAETNAAALVRMAIDNARVQRENGFTEEEIAHLERSRFLGAYAIQELKRSPYEAPKWSLKKHFSKRAGSNH